MTPDARWIGKVCVVNNDAWGAKVGASPKLGWAMKSQAVKVVKRGEDVVVDDRLLTGLSWMLGIQRV